MPWQISGEAQARRLGHVAEAIVPQVLVEPVGPFSSSSQRQKRSGGEVEVELAVVVVVEDGHARSVRGREVFVLGHPRKVHEFDAGLLRDLGEPKGTGRLGLSRVGPRRDDVRASDAPNAHNDEVVARWRDNRDAKNRS